jgi:hypothetical protein
MSEGRTYTGSCHCGKVKYTVDGLDLSKPVITCNCSMCHRAGTMLVFVPADQFNLESGEDAVTDYQFNKNIIHHLFCSTCGIKAFALGESDGKSMAAINVRCLEGVELKDLKVFQYDGRSK